MLPVAAGFGRPNGRHYHPQAPLRNEVPEGARRDPLSSFYDHRSQAPALVDAFGQPMVRDDDPAFQPPVDPLDDRRLAALAGIVHREIPNVSTQTGWAPGDVRQAIASMVVGLFDQSSQLSDSVMADSRVAATLASRTGGLLGRPVTFSIPIGFEDDDEAKAARDTWEANWFRIFPESVASEFLRWVLMQAFGVAQLTWDMDGEYACPEPMIWHPRYTYYHWLYRDYIALTLDGQAPIIPGDGQWVLHAPHGAYRGWMRGAVWSISSWWLGRNYALRDWSRYSERHGMPMILAKTPAASDPAASGAFKASLQNLGQETIVQLPQGVEEAFSYGLELLEATDQGWQGFHQLIEQCNTEITLAIMGQNLTTEVTEGSFAAARVHADVRQTLLEADARALERTIYEQIARPYAMMNWSRPEIAPVTSWDLQPYEDSHTVAQTLQAFAGAVLTLARCGKRVENVEELAKAFGLKLRLSDMPPLQSSGETGFAGGGDRP